MVETISGICGSSNPKSGLIHFGTVLDHSKYRLRSPLYFNTDGLTWYKKNNSGITFKCMQSIVTCKVLLNWPQPEAEQHYAVLC